MYSKQDSEIFSVKKYFTKIKHYFNNSITGTYDSYFTLPV
ncbi:hypothetical protein GFO_2650 [Christiangramia forsetii KT0803]|uniref:Uncharacterized protein n=1 Tax=Christiangramia forsetii (strain DSM 17595 / CGMCC 1.15422 / KT0803) TaxID=411154 RepID=A0M4R1_CHRFK|nr:hypothetical protein GFO_2650 [Christiangramia forsetii KT0803]